VIIPFEFDSFSTSSSVDDLQRLEEEVDFAEKMLEDMLGDNFMEDVSQDGLHFEWIPEEPKDTVASFVPTLSSLDEQPEEEKEEEEKIEVVKEVVEEPQKSSPYVQCNSSDDFTYVIVEEKIEYGSPCNLPSSYAFQYQNGPYTTSILYSHTTEGAPYKYVEMETMKPQIIPKTEVNYISVVESNRPYCFAY